MKNILIATSALAAVSSASAQTVVNPTNFPDDVTQDGNIINIVDDITLTSGEFILDSTTVVNPGATLTINPGVIVRGQPASDTTAPGTLLVSRGGALNAVGNLNAPIIFTTAADTNRERWEMGDDFLDADPAGNPLPPIDEAGNVANTSLWGAVTLLGYAPTNRGTGDTGVAGEAFIEGFGLTSEQATYGGSLPNDSSGSLSYVSIRHTGETIVEGDEQQGLTLGGVGAGTLLENIDIYCSQDDGIEIFGGTASLKNVIISYCNDDGFDLDQGWTGNTQFLFILNNTLPDNTDGGLITMDELGEWDGQDGVDEPTATINAAIADLATAADNFNADPENPELLDALTVAQTALDALTATGSLTATGQPFMSPTIYNMTVFGENAAGSLEIDAAFGGNIFNSILYGISRFDIEDETSANPILNGFPSASSADRLLSGGLNINGVTFIALDGLTAADVADTSFAEAVMTNDTAVALNSTTNVFTTGNPFFFGAASGGNVNVQNVANGVNPVPLTGATTGLVPVVGAFFDDAGFRGAFAQDGTAPLFTTGWTALNIRGILVDAGNGADIL